MASRRRPAGTAAGSERASALDQLKNLRQKGGKRIDAFNLKLEDRVYDEVSEPDYALLVAHRRKEANNFVVDDGDLGYADIGEEEEWDVNVYSDSEGEEIEHRVKKPRQKKEGGKISSAHCFQRLVDSCLLNCPCAIGPGWTSAFTDLLNIPADAKKEAQSKAAAAASAAAVLSKQRVSTMFAAASSLAKKSKEDGGNNWRGSTTENVLEDVLAEIGIDNVDREKEKRRRQGAAAGVGASAVHSTRRPVLSACQTLLTFVVQASVVRHQAVTRRVKGRPRILSPPFLLAGSLSGQPAKGNMRFHSNRTWFAIPLRFPSNQRWKENWNRKLPFMRQMQEQEFIRRPPWTSQSKNKKSRLYQSNLRHFRLSQKQRAPSSKS